MAIFQGDFGFGIAFAVLLFLPVWIWTAVRLIRLMRRPVRRIRRFFRKITA